MKQSLQQEGANGPPLWRRAALWLLLLGPLFFASYGGANWLASQRAEVGHIVFDWERYIPFVPWTILPYWIIDAMYAVSLFICTEKRELDAHAKRLLTAQLIAVTCFVLFPLGFTFERPPVEGWSGVLFTALAGFDKPFNQAPSLHIALLVILWVRFAAHAPGWLRWPLHLLGSLIAISVLTTYQHHFIDVPTGALLGWFAVWLWPTGAYTDAHAIEPARSERVVKLAVYYAVAAMVLAAIALFMGGWFLWLLWPAVSLLLVAVIYRWLGPAGFCKAGEGRLALASRWLLFPYLVGAWVNSRLWTLKTEQSVQIDEGVWIGRFPTRRHLRERDFKAVVDMTAEFHAPHSSAAWHALPSLDLVTLSQQQLKLAADAIERMRRKHGGSLLVSCALGFSRSAMAVAAWLLQSGRVTGADAAIAMVRQQRPQLVLRAEDQDALVRFAQSVASDG